MKPISADSHMVAGRDVFTGLADRFGDEAPCRIDRLGVRYVNRLDVPYFDEYSLDDYFTNTPKLFMKSKSGVEHFLTRLVLKLNHTQDINAVVIQTIDKPTDNILPLILDIDVSAQLTQEDQADIWSLLDRLREYKNDMFFHTMTPRSLDLCE